MSVRPQSILAVSAAFVCVATIGAGCIGCRRDQPEEIGSIWNDAGMSGPSDPKLGSQGAITVDRPNADGPTASTKRSYKDCPNPVPVRKGDPKTPEGTLFLVFQALLEPDEEVSFERFYSYINPLLQNKVDARRYWFASTRVKGGEPFLRLIYGPKDPSFDVCRRVVEAEGKIRIFVAKSPPVGSNPPYQLAKVGDKWLLQTFSPF